MTLKHLQNRKDFSETRAVFKLQYAFTEVKLDKIHCFPLIYHASSLLGTIIIFIEGYQVG